MSDSLPTDPAFEKALADVKDAVLSLRPSYRDDLFRFGNRYVINTRFQGDLLLLLQRLYTADYSQQRQIGNGGPSTYLSGCAPNTTPKPWRHFTSAFRGHVSPLRSATRKSKKLQCAVPES